MNASDFTVSGSFYKLGDYENRLPFGLKPDKQLNRYTWKYPVTWSGHVGWLNVSLIQNSRNEIDFSSLPPEMDDAKQHIKGKIELVVAQLVD